MTILYTSFHLLYLDNDTVQRKEMPEEFQVFVKEYIEYANANEKNKMYIESILNIKMRPVLFREALKDVLSFKTKEIVNVEKMTGWGDEE